MKPATQDEALRLDDLKLAPQWRAWLLARVAEEGSLAGAVRALIYEAALADVCRVQYEKEEELCERLREAGRSPGDVNELVVRWRLGEPIEGVTVGPPPAARILHPGVVSRMPQIRAPRRLSDLTAATHDADQEKEP